MTTKNTNKDREGLRGKIKEVILNSLLTTQSKSKSPSERREEVIGWLTPGLVSLFKKEFLELIGENTNFDKNGEPKMCWRCSFWGKDCECYHNLLLDMLREKVEEL